MEVGWELTLSLGRCIIAASAKRCTCRWTFCLSNSLEQLACSDPLYPCPCNTGKGKWEKKDLKEDETHSKSICRGLMSLRKYVDIVDTAL